MTSMTTSQQTSTTPADMWRDRQVRPDAARNQLRAMADTMTTHQLAEQCGTSFTELNDFLRPGIDPAVFAPADSKQDAVNLAWAYTRAGWSGSDIARASGYSRQWISKLLKISPTTALPAPVKPLNRRKSKPAPNYRQVKSLPAYELRLLDTLAGEYADGDDPAGHRLAAHAGYLASAYRTPLSHLAAYCAVDRGFLHAAVENAA